MNPKTMTARKKTKSPPSENAAEPRDMWPPFATPVMSAMMPTQMMSSQTDVPTAYLTNGRSDHFISSIIFASIVVAESQIAAPRKSEGTLPQPKHVRPIV